MTLRSKLIAISISFLAVNGRAFDGKNWISNEGVGPFQYEKPVNLSELKKEFPSLQFNEEKSTCGEGAPCTIISVEENSRPILQIELSGEVPGTIQVFSDSITTKVGIGLNSTFLEIRNKYPDLQCGTPATNSEIFECSTGKLPRVSFGALRPDGTHAEDDFNKSQWKLIKNMKGGITWQSWRGG